MGLDITAYRKIVKLDCEFDKHGEPIDPITRKPLDWETYFRVSINSDFSARADRLVEGVYSFEDKMGFRAGSYGGYNFWRENLARLAGYEAIPYNKYGHDVPLHAASAWKATAGPFWELINFSDCEGVIGPETSAKLAKDFADHQAKADAQQDPEQGYWLERYNNWREAFEMASDNGAVDFH